MKNRLIVNSSGLAFISRELGSNPPYITRERAGGLVAVHRELQLPYLQNGWQFLHDWLPARKALYLEK